MKLKTKDMILVSIFSALMVVGAYIRIPFPALPITLQPFFCALAGVLLGYRLGFLSQIIYIILGLIGLPVFAQGGGISYVLNPTFGFLAGFAVSTLVIGKIIEKLKTINPGTLLTALISGLAVIYAIGIPYMYLILGVYMKKPDITIGYVITVNIPYLIKDFVLYVIIAVTVLSALPALRKAGLSGIRQL